MVSPGLPKGHKVAIEYVGLVACTHSDAPILGPEVQFQSELINIVPGGRARACQSGHTLQKYVGVLEDSLEKVPTLERGDPACS